MMGYAGRIFHSSSIKFWDEKLVILFERVSKIKGIFEVLETLFSNGEQIFWI